MIHSTTVEHCIQRSIQDRCPVSLPWSIDLHVELAKSAYVYDSTQGSFIGARGTEFWQINLIGGPGDREPPTVPNNPIPNQPIDLTKTLRVPVESDRSELVDVLLVLFVIACAVVISFFWR